MHFICEGQTVDELVKAFSSWIDDYVAGFGEAGLDVVQPQVLTTA
ncbi:MAG: hypothetical protein AAGL17_10755 [Cyanobacteria bacterium J06576_12]